ncbi:MAG: hypothetical protein OXL39_14775 [Caldilineaceae bacterium]|nr:hypothetical protein [Caldilineaceae bacterium]
MEDPDDGKQLVVGETYRGNIDFPSDIDYLSLDLQQDEKVEIVVRSIMADSQLTVSGYRGENQGVLMVDENSGGGLFGLDARIVLHAPQPGDAFPITGKNPAPGDWWQDQLRRPHRIGVRAAGCRHQRPQRGGGQPALAPAAWSAQFIAQPAPIFWHNRSPCAIIVV